MYVELSARRTGKTTRLAEAIIAWLEADLNNIALVPFSPRQSYIKEHIPDEDYLKFKNSINFKFKNTLNSLRGLNSKHFAIFYDEFQMYNNVLITDNSYYVGTLTNELDLSKIHDLSYAPLPMKLIRANNYYFESYTCYENIHQEWVNGCEKSDFEKEFCGKIFIQEDVSNISDCFYENEKIDRNTSTP